jgi:hypothetical protein
MRCLIELALRRVPKPPKPVFDDFPYDWRIPDWPDAAQWRRRGQAAAGCRRSDRHRQQLIVVANPFRSAEQIEVKAVCQTTRPHIDA